MSSAQTTITLGARISASASTPFFFFDVPAEETVQDPLNISASGWVFGGPDHGQFRAVDVFVDGQHAGRTRCLFERPDVAQAVSPESLRSGWTVCISAPWAAGKSDAVLEISAQFGETAPTRLPPRRVRLIKNDYRREHYGNLVSPGETRLFQRQDIYGSGPSSPDLNPACLTLLKNYLPKPPASLLDVGCGLGAYASPLLAAGYAWCGVEVKESDCLALHGRGLNYRQVDGHTLPFTDGSIDAPFCIEVLEHIRDPNSFLREIRRVCRQRALFSVPNAELIPYMAHLRCVPWHLLEGDHQNFFSRASLRHLLSNSFRSVEILPYGEHPLKGREGFPLLYHLFAIAEV